MVLMEWYSASCIPGFAIISPISAAEGYSEERGAAANRENKDAGSEETDRARAWLEDSKRIP